MNNKEDCINHHINEVRYGRHNLQVNQQRIGHAGIFEVGNSLQVHTPIQYTDMRSYLCRVQACRGLVKDCIYYIIKNVCQGLPVEKRELYYFLFRQFGVNISNPSDLSPFADQVFIIIFCMIENVSLQRFRRVGLTNTWMEHINLSN